MIECINITKCFGPDNIIFENFSRLFGDEGIYGITGASGRGKTTLVRMIMGLEKTDGGEIKHSRKLRFSSVFPEDRLIPTLNVIDNIRYVVRDEKKIAEVLEIVGLTESGSKFPYELSSGMKRRVSLARAFAFPCDVLILDEPFKGLDRKLQSRIVGEIREYSKTILVILVSHDIAMLEEICRDLLDLEKM